MKKHTETYKDDSLFYSILTIIMVINLILLIHIVSVGEHKELERCQVQYGGQPATPYN